MGFTRSTRRSSGASGAADASLRFDVGPDELVIDNRYEVLSIINDVLIALFFLVGSILFFFESTQLAGTWLFLLGSIEFLARPVIRLVRRVHLTRVGATNSVRNSGYDY